MLIASHTMPGPSDASINVALLLGVLSPVVLICALTAFLAPSASTVRRAFAALVGTALGAVMLTLAGSLAGITAAVVAGTMHDVSIWTVVATGGVLFAVLGMFCLTWSARATQTVCRNWRGDLSDLDVRRSHDRLVAVGWAAGLLSGLIVALATTTTLALPIGALGGTLIAAVFTLRGRGLEHRR